MQKSTEKKIMIALRVLFTVLLIASVAFIFKNSLQIAAVSAGQSENIVERINVVLEKVDMEPVTDHQVRKMAHFSEFAMMGFFFLLCIWSYTKKTLEYISWPLFGGLMTAVLDETVQIYVEGRGSSTTDVLIDFGGLVAGLAAAWLGLMIVFAVIKRCHLKNMR